MQILEVKLVFPEKEGMKSSLDEIGKILLIIAVCATGCGSPGNPGRMSTSQWQEEFGLSERNLVPTGRNSYFILEPGFQLILESSNEKLAVTVLDETKEVEGVTTRVVEEREWKNGELKEVSLNFFAIDERTKDVFYFGEDVDMYEDEKVADHSGAWLTGKGGAKAGLAMPGKPRPGMKYYQEMAPGKAMDRAVVVKLDDMLETPAGVFSNCLLTKEGSSLNPFEIEFKTYAPDIGLIQDEKLLLTQYGFIEKQ
jgi:hypothetical protein